MYRFIITVSLLYKYNCFKRYFLINSKLFFGTDGNLPTNNFLQLDKTIIRDKDKKIEVGKNDMQQYFS